MEEGGQDQVTESLKVREGIDLIREVTRNLCIHGPELFSEEAERSHCHRTCRGEHSDFHAIVPLVSASYCKGQSQRYNAAKLRKSRCRVTKDIAIGLTASKFHVFSTHFLQ